MSGSPREKQATMAPGAESPTTAQPLEFDDDAQDNAAQVSRDTAVPASSNLASQNEEAPPAKPPRPASPHGQAETTLLEAFPTLDAKVVKAVLVASGGKLEPAFNALLSMSDPNFQAESATESQNRPDQRNSQLESDEQYARQLAAHLHQTSIPRNQSLRTSADQSTPRSRGNGDPSYNELHDDKDYSFFDDDLPVIRDNVKKGFMETQAKVNQWITDFKRRIDGDDDEDGDNINSHSIPNRRANQDPSRYNVVQPQRRSGDRERYDSDPRVLDDNFTELQLRDDEAPPKFPPRPPANPNLFKATPPPPQSGAVDEVEAAQRSFSKDPTSSATKAKKWQPLTSIAPDPVDADPFSLGDSDEEPEFKTKATLSEDAERLKRASYQATVEEGDGRKLEPAERSGSAGIRDKEAEEILTAK